MSPVHPKVVAASIGAGVGAGIGNALATVFVWLLALHGVQIPDPVSQAFAVLFAAAISLASGYLTPTTAQTTEKGPTNG